MATFDAKAYKTNVLRPFSKGEGAEQLREVLAEMTRDPQSEAYARLDLNALFAVPTPVEASELKSWRTSIVPTLNKAKGLPAAQRIKQLLESIEKQGVELNDPSFWGGMQARRQTYIHATLSEKIGQLRVEYPLGIITIEELVSRLETVGITGVTEGSVRKVASDNDLQIVDELTLPIGGVPKSIRTVWQRVMQHAEYRSILDVLLIHRSEDAHDVSFIDALKTPNGPIGIADVERALRKSEQGKDTNALQSAQKLLVAIKNSCHDDAEIAQVVLTTVVDAAEGQLRRGKPKIAVRDQLAASGFIRSDIARIVAAVGAQSSTGSEASMSLAQVRQFLSEGELAQAERTLTAISSDDDEQADRTELHTEINRLKALKKTALDSHHSAVAKKDYATALTAINEAINIDQGDETLVTRRDALPPSAPRSFASRVTEADVTLSWAQEADTTITYTVVRGRGHAPTSPTDGDVVSSQIAGSSSTDDSAPIASQVTYAIFATRDGSMFSDVIHTTILVLPAPTSLRSTADLTNVQISWECPSAAAGVVVTQQEPDGTTSDHEISHGSTLRVSSLTTGAKYRFLVRAVYLLDGGRQLSEPASTTVIPRGQAQGVRDLEVVAADAGLQASWTEIDGYNLELWSFAPQTVLPEGEHVNLTTLVQLGGTRTALLPGATSSEARLAPFDGFARIVPLTIADEGCFVGYSVIAGTAQPATQIVTEAFGEDLRISWKWPADDCIMELSWHVDGTRRTRRVTPARYRKDGGVTIVGGVTAAADLSIGTVVRFDDDESVLARTPIPWVPDAVARSASYDLKIQKSLMGKVSCDITARSDATGYSIPARVVLKRGSVMPWDADDGRVVDSIELDFTADTTSRHEIEIGKEKPPFWVCVFTLDDSKLTPPATRAMKG